ncbi:MAG TPA: M14 family metallopeptidase [Phycisphaerales bacterium]|nr:M14 family metallopeptidase [Phycisphaerales bacterium]
MTRLGSARRLWVLFLAALGLVQAAPAQEPPARFDGHKVVRASVRTLNDLRVLLAVSEDPWSESVGVGGPVDFRVPADALPVLDEAGVPYRVIIEDVQALIDRERAELGAPARGPGWHATYHPLNEISAFVDTLVAQRPDLATRLSVGTSVQGREIFAIRITGPGDASTRPIVVFSSVQHAREWIAAATTQWIADRLVSGYDTDSSVRTLVDAFEIIIIPVVNPDGYVYTWTTNRLWRKNRRDNGNGTFGVDNNRNWGYQWGGEGASTNPGNDTYRGTGPFSEPETAAMRDFITARPRVLMHVDFHSYSQLILSPWGYTVSLPPDALLFEHLNAGMQQAIASVHGMGYAAGPSYTTIYPASGVAPDWSYGDRGALGWTIELRDTGQNGFILPADQIVPTAEEAFAGVRWTTEWLRTSQLFFGFPGGAPRTVPAGATTPITFEVRRGLAQPQDGTARLFWRLGRTGPFTEAAVTGLPNRTYSASVTAGPCNSVVQFYLDAQTAAGVTVRYPASGALEAVAATSVTLWADAAEQDNGWATAAPGDTATAGLWVRGDPNGTSAQPEDAHSPVACYFTGQGSPGGAAGAADVDGGVTSLLTPSIPLAGQTGVRAGYWRWYSNSAGAAPNQDVFIVEASGDGGATWQNVETVGPAGAGTAGGWVYHEFALAGLLPGAGSLRLAFRAADTGPGSLVEAAIDDVVVTASGCPAPCAADFDGNGLIGSGDISLFLTTWFDDLAAGTTGADFNSSGSVTPADISAFLSAWFGALSGTCG